MRPVLAIVFVLALVAAVLADFSIGNDRLQVSFEGNSGHMRFYTNSSSNWWVLNWESIEECSPSNGNSGNGNSGNPPDDKKGKNGGLTCGAGSNKISNFANCFEFVGPTTKTQNGVTSINVLATCVASVGGKSVRFETNNTFFEQQVDVINSLNQTVSVPKNSFKFGFNVSNWPFESSDNSLAVNLELQSKGGKQSQSKDVVSMGGAVLLLENTADVDGSSIDVDTTLTQNGGGSNSQLSVTVPSFDKYAAYDPVFSVESGGHHHSAARIVVPVLLFLGALLLLAIIVGVAIVAVVYSRRNVRGGYERA